MLRLAKYDVATGQQDTPAPALSLPSMGFVRAHFSSDGKSIGLSTNCLLNGAQRPCEEQADEALAPLLVAGQGGEARPAARGTSPL